jgi:2TM domain
MSITGAPTSTRTSEEQARRRARYLAGLLWHTGAFLIINAGFWALDLGLGQSGLQWAFWITGVWGIALAFHALAYFIDGRGVEERKYRQYLEASRRHEAAKQ